MSNLVNLSDSDNLRVYLKKFFPDISDTEESYEEAFVSLMKINKEVFCNNLQDIRFKSNLTQYQAAEFLSVSQSSYSAWESGRHLPRIDMVKKMVTLYQVDPIVFIYSDTVQIAPPSHLTILHEGFFVKLKFDDFSNRFNELISRGIEDRLVIYTSNSYNFAYYVHDSSMSSMEGGIPKHSFLLCNVDALMDSKIEDRLNIVNGTVAIVSYKNGPAYPRYVEYVNGKVRLVQWNHISRRFSMKDREHKLQLKAVEEISFDCKVDDVEIYAIVLDCYLHITSVY